jgi:hypothetical protein
VFVLSKNPLDNTSRKDQSTKLRDFFDYFLADMVVYISPLQHKKDILEKKKKATTDIDKNFDF